MKAKRIFWKKANVSEAVSTVPCAPCPFVGVTVNSIDEFISEVLQKRLFRPNGNFNDEGRPLGKYPVVDFSTKDSNRILMFAGHNFFKGSPVREDGSLMKWALYDVRLDDIIAYYDIKKDEDRQKVWNLFEDDAVVQRQIDVMSAIVKRDGGITINVR